MKKIVFSLFLILVTFCNTAFAESPDMSEWAKPEINEVLNLGFIPEDMQNNYTSNITRAEFAKISVLFVAYHFNLSVEEMVSKYLSEHVDQFGNPLTFQENAFTDIKGSEHEYYIKCANSMGIVVGKGEGKFDPDAHITRQEAATMLLRVYFCYGGGVKLGPKSAEVDNFYDVKEISSWADTAVRYMYQWDVMKGFSKTQYSPNSHYTREQCYITFLRLNNVYSIR